jgi:hypothetical protein
MTITYICGGCERTETLEVLSGPDPEQLRRAILPCDWEEIGCVAYCPECKGRRKALYQRAWGRVQ